MSTHVLDDVELITRQEVEAMITAPVTELQEAIADEKTAREDADTAIQAALDAETANRESADITLQEKIDTEASTRAAADTSLTAAISNEAQLRAAADEALNSRIDEMKAIETDHQPHVDCVRFAGMPFATITLNVEDLSLSIGDIVASVSERYKPAQPTAFFALVEQVDVTTSLPKTCLASFILDANGNISVTNLVDVADGTSATDSATVSYITVA